LVVEFCGLARGLRVLSTPCREDAHDVEPRVRRAVGGQNVCLTCAARRALGLVPARLLESEQAVSRLISPSDRFSDATDEGEEVEDAVREEWPVQALRFLPHVPLSLRVLQSASTTPLLLPVFLATGLHPVPRRTQAIDLPSGRHQRLISCVDSGSARLPQFVLASTNVVCRPDQIPAALSVLDALALQIGDGVDHPSGVDDAVVI
jgi:hypothetical protein